MSIIDTMYTHILSTITSVIDKKNKIAPVIYSELTCGETCTCSRNHFYGHCLHILKI
jgi:hypothetical protein